MNESQLMSLNLARAAQCRFQGPSGPPGAAGAPGPQGATGTYIVAATSFLYFKSNSTVDGDITTPGNLEIAQPALISNEGYWFDSAHDYTQGQQLGPIFSINTGYGFTPGQIMMNLYWTPDGPLRIYFSCCCCEW